MRLGGGSCSGRLWARVRHAASGTASPPDAKADAPAKPTLGSGRRPTRRFNRTPARSSTMIEAVRLHRRAHRRPRRKPATDSAAEHLESGEGIPESAEMVKGHFEQLGCQESKVLTWAPPNGGRRAIPSSREVRRRRAHTLVIYWSDTMPRDAAGRLGGAAVRRTAGRAGALQESADWPRRHEFKRAADGPAECVHGDQSRHREAAGESDLRG